MKKIWSGFKILKLENKRNIFWKIQDCLDIFDLEKLENTLPYVSSWSAWIPSRIKYDTIYVTSWFLNVNHKTLVVNVIGS